MMLWGTVSVPDCLPSLIFSCGKNKITEKKAPWAQITVGLLVSLQLYAAKAITVYTPLDLEARNRRVKIYTLVSDELTTKENLKSFAWENLEKGEVKTLTGLMWLWNVPGISHFKHSHSVISSISVTFALWESDTPVARFAETTSQEGYILVPALNPSVCTSFNLGATILFLDIWVLHLLLFGVYGYSH